MKAVLPKNFFKNALENNKEISHHERAYNDLLKVYEKRYNEITQQEIKNEPIKNKNKKTLINK